MQKIKIQKAASGKANPRPSGAFTHRIREMVRSSPVRKVAIPPLTLPPCPPWPGPVRMRSTDSDRSVRATPPKKARDGQPTTPGRSVGGREEP
ncbi:hypothetical protein BASA83_009117 [Batrachochytrium salamandrivorans]|nr:hypothetical protein BASA83_009117 [Batrachochytrium salamandrivorans]